MLKKSEQNLQNIDYRSALIDLGYNIPAGDKVRVKAIYRGGQHNNSLSIDFTTGRFFDFGAEQEENKKGTLARLIELSGGKIAGLKTSTENPNTSNNFYSKNLKSYILDTKVYSEGCLKKLMPFYDFYLKKGISEKTLRDFEAGYSTRETFAGRILFPVRDFGNKIVGFNGRLVEWNEKSPYPKWLLTKSSKRYWVYNHKLAYSEILKKKEVILVESIGDNLALYECGIKNVIVLFGKELSPAIIKYLLSLQCDIIISTNKDGKDNNFVGEKAAEKIKSELDILFKNVKIRLPEFNDHMDVFEVFGKDKVLSWYKDTKKEFNPLTKQEKIVECREVEDIYNYYA